MVEKPYRVLEEWYTTWPDEIEWTCSLTGPTHKLCFGREVETCDNSQCGAELAVRIVGDDEQELYVPITDYPDGQSCPRCTTGRLLRVSSPGCVFPLPKPEMPLHVRYIAD